MTATGTTLPVKTLVKLYRTMATIRSFEERVHELFQDGELPGFLHLCSGQEAVAAGVVDHLRPGDSIASNHRNHGHALAKGVSAQSMMIELYGRAGGTNEGKGGSMHIADPAVGHVASGGIVGASAPLALGPAQAAKLDGRDDIAVAFFGDGGAQQGTVLESMNLAAVWSLPVVFVCENNVFGQATPVTYASAVPPSERAAGFGIPAEKVDGQDVIAVHEAARRAVERARSGRGPSYLEFTTYSYHGAWEGEPKRAYRLPEIEQEFRTRDPLVLLSERLAADTDDWQAVKDGIDDEIHDVIEEAVEAGRSAEFPEVSTLTTDVYADRRVTVDRDGLSSY
ncbi:thiamine pyrophosphate-dependent dehydrogenase E1 component subunit alpha [Streptomyces sp. AD55]|uniref:thiamine pyrophosphate-dependent dehydrogenase E1 component subunit alpha n=1 Tax=Streptomyces sp. AD55 TaxID=3242895 RepID=UPI003527AC78